MSTNPKCIGLDPLCPCQDGDGCHYLGKDAFPIPSAMGQECTCRACGKTFAQRSTLQAVCSPKCALGELKAAKRHARAERGQTRSRLEALKPRSHWLRLTQAAFNRFVRMRDAHLPCISCGRMHDGQWHAGHYLTVGARPELRFDADNVHRQCSPCNMHLHGNLIEYRRHLIERIGTARVESLEGPHPAAKWSIPELQAMRAEYAAKAKSLGGLGA